MRDLGLLLTQLAAVVAATMVGCNDEGPGCGPPPPMKNITMTPQQACDTLAVELGVLQLSPGAQSPCGSICGAPYSHCDLPANYTKDFVDANPVPGSGATPADASAPPLPPRCPDFTTSIPVTCSGAWCYGRRMAGAPGLPVRRGMSAGAYFAACAYLEAVSVHAFARLAAELTHFGAPRALVSAARRSELEELRHTAFMSELARRFRAEPEMPAPPDPASRSLLEVAVENAVEGCIRETFGAAMALLCAERTPLAEARATLRTIASEECGHAELSWQIHAWVLPRLDEEERRMVREAMREVIQELRLADDLLSSDARLVSGTPPLEGRRRLVELLDRNVYEVAA